LKVKKFDLKTSISVFFDTMQKPDPDGIFVGAALQGLTESLKVDESFILDLCDEIFTEPGHAKSVSVSQFYYRIIGKMTKAKLDTSFIA
jgi:hypothetical protein